MVKHKDIRVYLYYIYESTMRKRSIIHKVIELENNEERVRIEHLLYEVLTETTLAQPIMLSLPFILVHAEFMRHRL